VEVSGLKEWLSVLKRRMYMNREQKDVPVFVVVVGLIEMICPPEKWWMVVIWVMK